MEVDCVDGGRLYDLTGFSFRYIDLFKNLAEFGVEFIDFALNYWGVVLNDSLIDSVDCFLVKLLFVGFDELF